MLLFVVLCLNQFAKRSALAGSMYGYTGRGLGPTAGVLSGWTLIWSYLFIGIAGLTGFSIFAAEFLSALGLKATVAPVFFFLLSAAVCWFIAYKDIRVSSLLTLVLECLSVACILSLAAVVLFKHGISVDTDQLKLKGMGLHGLSLAVVVCIFSLVGFESATTLGSEAKRPLKNVPRAVICSLLITGAFMVFMSYVEVFGTRHAGTSLADISAPLTELSRLYGVTAFRIPVALGAMVSFFSLTLSCLNAGSRIIYPMAQHMIFPKHLGRAHQENQTPHVAITVYIAVMVTVPLRARDLHQPTHHLRRRRHPGRLRLPHGVLPHLHRRPRLPAQAWGAAPRPRGGDVPGLPLPRWCRPSAASTRCRRSPWTSSRTSSWPTCWSAPVGCSW